MKIKINRKWVYTFIPLPKMLGFWHTNYQIETYKISGVRKVFAKGRVKNVSNGKDMRIIFFLDFSENDSPIKSVGQRTLLNFNFFDSILVFNGIYHQFILNILVVISLRREMSNWQRVPCNLYLINNVGDNVV